MELNYFTIFLLLVVIVLIAYIAYMKGQKSKNTPIPNDSKPIVPPQNTTKQEKFSTLKIDQIPTNQKPPVKRDPDNINQINRAKVELAKSCQNIAENTTYKVFESFIQAHEELADYYASLSNQQSTPIYGIEKMINWGPISQIRTSIETNIIDVTEFAGTFCYGSLEYLEESYPNAKLNNLIKNDAQIDMGKQRLQSSIRKNLPAFYSELNELGNCQARCLSLWRGAKGILNESGVDVPSLAKNFGAGVLIAINPLIGVPALIASIFGDNEKAKRKQETIDEFFDAFTKYLYKWDEVRKLAVDTIAPVMVRDINTFLVSEGQNNIIKGFEAADIAGYSIKEKTDELIKYLTE